MCKDETYEEKERVGDVHDRSEKESQRVLSRKDKRRFNGSWNARNKARADGRPGRDSNIEGKGN